MKSRLSVFSALAILAAAQQSLVVAADDKPAEESWQVINLSGQRVGFGRVSTREIERDGQTVFVIEHSEQLTIKRFGQSLRIETRTRTEETAAGRLLNYEYVMNNPPASSSRTVGTVDGKKLKIVSTVAGRERTRNVDFDPSVRSPGYLERSIREKPLQSGETRSVRMFLPEYGKVTSVRVSADDLREVKLYDGSTAKLLKVRTSMTLLPGVEIRSFVEIGRAH
ncbi:MAG: hypothetical protein VB858_00385, partial [Planctomycetaceae bacterium]